MREHEEMHMWQNTTYSRNSPAGAAPVGEVRRAMTGIEGLAQTFAQEVDAGYGQGNGQTRENGEPGRFAEIQLSLVQHAAPRSRGRRNAEAEVAEGRLDQDGVGHEPRAGDGHGTYGVRKKMHKDDAEGRCPGSPGRL